MVLRVHACIMNNFHHIPSSCIIKGTCGKRLSAHAQSMRVRVHAMPQSQRCRSTLDLDSRQKRRIDVSVTGLTRQYSTVWIGTVRSTRMCIACMNVCAS